MLDNIEQECYKSGRWIRENVVDIQNNFVNPSLVKARKSISDWVAASEVVDGELHAYTVYGYQCG
jgi:hypothetical protein